MFLRDLTVPLGFLQVLLPARHPRQGGRTALGLPVCRCTQRHRRDRLFGGVTRFPARFPAIPGTLFVVSVMRTEGLARDDAHSRRPRRRRCRGRRNAARRRRPSAPVSIYLVRIESGDHPPRQIRRDQGAGRNVPVPCLGQSTLLVSGDRSDTWPGVERRVLRVRSYYRYYRAITEMKERERDAILRDILQVIRRCKQPYVPEFGGDEALRGHGRVGGAFFGG